MCVCVCLHTRNTYMLNFVHTHSCLCVFTVCITWKREWEMCRAWARGWKLSFTRRLWNEMCWCALWIQVTNICVWIDAAAPTEERAGGEGWCAASPGPRHRLQPQVSPCSVTQRVCDLLAIWPGCALPLAQCQVGLAPSSPPYDPQRISSMDNSWRDCI